MSASSEFTVTAPALSRPQLAARADDFSAGQEQAPTCSTGFVLFILVNLVLFVRPAEIVPEWENAPIYEIIICLSLLASFSAIARQLTPRSLLNTPTTVFMFAMLPALVLSSISHRDLYDARIQALNFVKILAYYLLLVGLVSTPSRLRIFARFMFFAVSVMAVLVLMDNYGVINVAVLHPMSQGVISGDNIDGTTTRVIGLGIFSDPNDLALILTAATALGLHFLFESPGLMLKVIWAIPLLLVMWTFQLTESRGGLIGMGAAISTLLILYLGWRRGLILVALVALLAVPLLGRRQTNLNLGNSDDTAQGRMELWRDGLVMFHATPVVGIGPDHFVKYIGHVAHNSFVQAFVETGLIGGTIFVGVNLAPIYMLRRIRRRTALMPGDEFTRWNPALMAVSVGYVVGMFSLSRNYTVPTYIPPALATAWYGIMVDRHPALVCRLDRAIIGWVIVASILCLAVAETCARFFIR